MEATRLKRSMEGDLTEMELQLSCASRQASEATKSLGQLQTQIKVFSIVVGMRQGHLCLWEQAW